MSKTIIDVMGASVPFVTYEDKGLTFFEFDTSMSEPPAPMVNAMSGLKLLDSDKKRLVMINMHAPKGLFPKIEADFEWEIEDIENGNVCVIYRLKGTEATSTDFESTQCSG